MTLIKKAYYILEFVVFYLVKLVQANIYIAWDILTPKMHTKPAFMEVPVTLKSNLGLLLFSNLLSMTPGTLSMDITEDRKKLIIHVLYYSTDDIMLKDLMDIQDKIKRITG
jgi:multicomponent Na+:H+ antiporter subunit E